ncbi:MAG: hypothetical protein HUJ56_07030, partial [Erysipelotrichaceae bacterium]|nr:hypothetical protein [Erysipelotrichaceae bacterium]
EEGIEKNQGAGVEDNQGNRIFNTEFKKIVTKDEMKQRYKDANPDAIQLNYLTNEYIDRENEISEADFMYKVRRMSAKVNQDMHGIYNEEDMNRASFYVWGRWLLMYRKFIAPTFKKRFGKNDYSMDLGMKTSGMYTTLWQTIAATIKGKLPEQIDTMSRYERGNFLRLAANISMLLVNELLISLAEKSGWDDDEDDWWRQFWLLQLYRNRDESVMWSPEVIAINSTFAIANLLGAKWNSPFRASVLEAWLSILSSPIPGVSIISKGEEGIFVIAESWSLSNRSDKNDFTKMSGRSYSKLPRLLKERLYYLIIEEQYPDQDTWFRNGLNKIIGLDEEDLQIVKDYWDNADKDERQRLLDTVKNGPTYGMEALTRFIPYYTPFKRSLHPENSLNYHQRKYLADRFYRYSWKKAFSDFDEDTKQVLKDAGYNSKTWPELTTPQRLEIQDMLENGTPLPEYEYFSQGEIANSLVL